MDHGHVIPIEQHVPDGKSDDMNQINGDWLNLDRPTIWILTTTLTF